MKVIDLIAALKMLDPQYEVVISIDPEGNLFRTVYEISDEGMDDRKVIIWPTDTLVYFDED